MKPHPNVRRGRKRLCNTQCGPTPAAPQAAPASATGRNFPPDTLLVKTRGKQHSTHRPTTPRTPRRRTTRALTRLTRTNVADTTECHYNIHRKRITITHYRSNLRDIIFNLFELHDAAGYYGTGPFSATDPAQAQQLLAELDRFCRTSIWAESFAITDRTPLSLSPEGDVTIPEPLHQALEAYYQAGWQLLPLPEHLGGSGAPPTLQWASAELLAGSHATASLWPIGALIARIIDQIGTAGQKTRFALPTIEHNWGGTMVLTEPDAGSDVGAATTRARLASYADNNDLGDVYHLEGVKRFITSADCQTHDNTIHLVLARPEGAAAGTKGLSLFIVPKRHVNADSTLGARNGIRVSNLENKMGIKGSATCEITLGQDGTPCLGYLAGNIHDGIRQMFLVIEYARMMVGTKAMATLSTGYLNALEYAKTRQQGTDLASGTRSPQKVAVIRHPDVRRMLMEQKSHAEGMRALVLYAGHISDQAHLAAHTNSINENRPESDSHDTWIARESLLLPLVKGYCSEKAYELLALSLQTFGGSGYTQDYPIEQYIRDAKIDTLYEGTTGIQGMDLLYRQIIKNQGKTYGWLTGQIGAWTADDSRTPFEEERSQLHDATKAVQQHLEILITHAATSQQPDMQNEIYKTGLHTTAFLHSLAELTTGWLLLRQAEVAHNALQHETALKAGEREFYQGKVASGRWFADHTLPKIAGRTSAAATETGWIMELPDQAL